MRRRMAPFADSERHRVYSRWSGTWTALPRWWVSRLSKYGDGISCSKDRRQLQSRPWVNRLIWINFSIAHWSSPTIVPRERVSRKRTKREQGKAWESRPSCMARASPARASATSPRWLEWRAASMAPCEYWFRARNLARARRRYFAKSQRRRSDFHTQM